MKTAPDVWYSGCKQSKQTMNEESEENKREEKKTPIYNGKSFKRDILDILNFNAAIHFYSLSVFYCCCLSVLFV